jgi:hypothetical protein
VQPILNRQDAVDRQASLQQSHEAAFADVLQEFPEFGDTNSAERRTFNEIWQNSSLRGDPDGPLQVAYQVRGVLADEVARRADQEPRKRAASVIKPGPVPQDSTTSAADVKRKNVSAEGLRRIRLGSDDPQDYIAVRKAQRRSGKRAHIQEGF